jgi:MFS family permease
MTATQPTEELTYCTVHPDHETSLRCNKCGRLMCADCAVSTPVGYRCKQCVRQHEDKFFSANQNDYAIVFGVCAALSGIGGYIASLINIFLILFFIGIPVGGFVAEAALRATKRRRGRYSGEIGAGGVVVGGLVGGLLHTYSIYSSAAARVAENTPDFELPPVDLSFLLQSTLSDVGLLVFIGVVAFFVYSRFKMRA